MSRQSLPSSYRWVVLGVTTVGVLMVSIDATVVILAIPDIMVELGANLISVTWVLMAYIFATTVLLLSLGRVADIYGRVKLYNVGFVVFTVGSAFCGLAQSDNQLIGARVLQGVGGALMLVNSWAILTEVFPPDQRGMAMGLNSMVFGLGSIAGPLLGGFILAAASWRWIFLINLPVGTIGTLAAYRYLREMSRPSREERLDPAGTLSCSLGLFALLLALTQGVSVGFLSPPILALLGFSAAALAFFLAWERRYCCPALDLRLFRSRQFNFAITAATIQAVAVFAVQFMVVFYLQAVRGNSALQAALLLLPMPVALAAIGPFSGRLSDKIGPRLPTTAGLLVQALGIYMLSTVTPDTPYPFIMLGLGLAGFGGGLFFSPNTSAAMGAAPRERLGVASATLSTLRNTGMVTSYALALAISAASLPPEIVTQLFLGTATHLGTDLMAAFVEGMETALCASALICLIAAALSFVRGSQSDQGIPAAGQAEASGQ